MRTVRYSSETPRSQNKKRKLSKEKSKILIVLYGTVHGVAVCLAMPAVPAPYAMLCLQLLAHCDGLVRVPDTGLNQAMSCETPCTPADRALPAICPTPLPKREKAVTGT